MSTEALPLPHHSIVPDGKTGAPSKQQTHQITRTATGFTINQIAAATGPLRVDLSLQNLWEWMRKFDHRREEIRRVIQWASGSSDATISIQI